MDRIPVESEDLKSVGYDEKNKILEVEFHSGGLYRYYGIGKVTQGRLLTSKSKGTFFHTYIRDIYPHRRMKS